LDRKGREGRLKIKRKLRENKEDLKDIARLY